MAVPKGKPSKSASRMRRSHHALKAVGSKACPNCGEPSLPHHVCAECGHYAGRQVIVRKVKADDKTTQA